MMRKRCLWACCGLAMAVFATFVSAYDLAEGHRGIREVKTEQRLVALTFDDGPDETTTQALLEVLKAYNAKATFFVMGRRAEDLPAQLRMIAGSGHEIGNHGYSHKWLTKLSEHELADEISRTEAAIMVAAPKPTLFRPPGAYYNDRIINELTGRGYAMVMWSIDTRDWARKDAAGVANDVVLRIKPGSIVLMHDGSCASSTPKAVGMILEQLSKQDYRFVTVSELIRAGSESQQKTAGQAAGI